MNKNPSLNKQASALFIGGLMGMIFQFMIPVILVRLISKEDFGIFRQFQLVASTILSFLAMGYLTSLFYFYPISDFKGKQKIIQQTQFLFMINLVLFFIIFYFSGNQILSYFNFAKFMDMKLYLVSYISFMLLSSVVSIIFTLEKNTLLNKLFPSSDMIVRFIVFLITILVIPGLKGPIIALIIYSFFRLIYYLIHITPYIKKFYKIDFELLKKQLYYALPFGFAIILNEVSISFDKFYINRFITPEEYGVYSVAFLGIPVLGFFFSSIHNVVVPRISIYMTENKVKEATVLWKKMVDKTSNVTIPAVFLFLLLADEIITILYTKDYIEAANYYRIFILTFLVSMFSYNIILRGANKTKYILYADIIGVVVTILFGIVLIPRIGLYGAILTAIIGRITPQLISLHIERKIMKQNFVNWVNWKDMGINFLISLFVTLPLFFFKDFINNIYLRFVITGFIFVLLLIVLQIRFKIFIFDEYLSTLKRKLKLN